MCQRNVVRTSPWKSQDVCSPKKARHLNRLRSCSHCWMSDLLIGSHNYHIHNAEQRQNRKLKRDKFHVAKFHFFSAKAAANLAATSSDVSTASWRGSGNVQRRHGDRETPCQNVVA